MYHGFSLVGLIYDNVLRSHLHFLPYTVTSLARRRPIILDDGMQPLGSGEIPSFYFSESIAPLTWLSVVTGYFVVISYCIMPHQRRDTCCRMRLVCLHVTAREALIYADDNHKIEWAYIVDTKWLNFHC